MTAVRTHSRPIPAALATVLAVADCGSSPSSDRAACPTTKASGAPPQRVLLNFGDLIASASDPGWFGNGALWCASSQLTTRQSDGPGHLEPIRGVGPKRPRRPTRSVAALPLKRPCHALAHDAALGANRLRRIPVPLVSNPAMSPASGEGSATKRDQQ